MYVQKSGDPETRVDLVFVSEGYTAGEMQRFYSDVERLTAQMFAASSLTSPFHEYEQYFNVRALFAPSEQSGYSTATRSVDTAFDATATLSDGRGIIGDGNLVRRFVNQNLTILEQDVIVVLVNTADHGGAASGNVAWVTARNTQSSEVLMHEIGHTFAGLNDEYVSNEIAAFLPLTSSTLVNSSHLSTSRTDVPWSAWLGYRDELGVVGVYEGGYYRQTGVWRATTTSKMRDSDQPFSAPQKEAIVLAIYDTVGSAGHLEKLTPFVYQVQPIDPQLASISWFDSVGNTHDFGFDRLTTYGLGAERLTFTVSDTGGFVRSNLEKTRSTVSLRTDEPFLAYDQLGSDLNRIQGQAIVFSGGDDTVALNDLTGSFLAFGLGRDALYLGLGHQEVEIEFLSDSVWLLSAEVNGLDQYVATSELERIIFNDQRAFALNDPVVEQAFRLYQAAFARQPEDDGLGYWADVLGRGASLNGVAQGFTESVEFLARYGESPSHVALVAAFYTNVLGRVQDDEGAAFWVDHLNAGRLQPHSVLAQFSESTENVERLDPLLSQGVWFNEWVG